MENKNEESRFYDDDNIENFEDIISSENKDNNEKQILSKEEILDIKDEEFEKYQD